MADIYTPKDELSLPSSESVPEVKPTISSLSAPAGVRFEIQDEDEEIILLLRKHWVTNFTWIFLALLLLVAPIVLRYFPFLNFLPTRYQLMGIIFWYLLMTAFVFEQFLSWYFNVYIVTNERIIDYDFHNLLYKDVTEAEIKKIQDTSFKIGGLAGVIFNYGDILIETAGAIPNLQFEAVPNPALVQKVIYDLREKVAGGPGI